MRDLCFSVLLLNVLLTVMDALFLYQHFSKRTEYASIGSEALFWFTAFLGALAISFFLLAIKTAFRCLKVP